MFCERVRGTAMWRDKTCVMELLLGFLSAGLQHCSHCSNILLPSFSSITPSRKNSLGSTSLRRLLAPEPRVSLNLFKSSGVPASGHGAR